tara:strand:+ start:120 stop:404 length:285 start_codon:yes stop_codon:yes gene_type:complete
MMALRSTILLTSRILVATEVMEAQRQLEQGAVMEHQDRQIMVAVAVAVVSTEAAVVDMQTEEMQQAIVAEEVADIALKVTAEMAGEGEHMPAED